MKGIGLYLSAVDGLIVLSVLFYLWGQMRQLLAFNRNIRALPLAGLGAEPTPFSGTGELPKLGNQFIHAFRTASNNNSLSSFDVEKQLTPLALRLRSMGASTRAVAGLLILVALVITLANLQDAVHVLGETFKQLSDNKQAGDGVVRSVESAMSGIADSATNAFQLSGLTIGSALVLLTIALGLQRQALQDLRRILAWGNSAYAALAAENARKNPAEQQADFSTAIKSFSTLVDSFGTLSNELATLGEFRTELATAVASISTAVDKLPASIQANMSSLSSEVTREIDGDLKRQYEILKQLVGIYGDMGLNVKSVESYIDQLVKQHGEASKALVSLTVLPADMRKLSQSSESLSAAVVDLKKKTDEIPAFDFQPTQTAINELEGSLQAIQASLEKFRDRTQMKQDGLDAVLVTIMNRMNDVSKASADLKQEAVGPLTYQMAEIQRRLEQVDSGVQRADYGKLILEIQHQLTEMQKRGLFGNLFGK